MRNLLKAQVTHSSGPDKYSDPIPSPGPSRQIQLPHMGVLKGSFLQPLRTAPGQTSPKHHKSSLLNRLPAPHLGKDPKGLTQHL